MMRLTLPVWCLALWIASLSVCPAPRAGSLGDPAFEFQVGEWIQGGPLTLAKGAGKTIFVIEFWQTECPHCLESLPYLSDLQEQYRGRDVQFIGITDEDPETVKAFLKENQEATYALAADDDDKTYDRYMGAFDVSGVPHAFIIGRQGRILWQGHPMDGLDQSLEQIVDGRYDLAAAQNLSRAGKLLTAYVYLSIETDEYRIARQVGLRVYAYGVDNAALLNKLARFITANKKVRRPDFELALQAAGRACVLTGEKDPVSLETYARVLSLTGAEKRARAYLQKAKSLGRLEESGASE